MISRSLRHRAPVLWLLLPMAGGLIAGRLWPNLPGGHLLVGAAAMYMFHLAAALRRPEWVLSWAITLCLAVFLAGAAFYGLHRQRLRVWDELPPREARLQVQIERVFAPKPDAKSVNGIGRVTAAKPPLLELVGQRIAFSVVMKRARQTAPFISSEVRELQGIVESLPLDAPINSFDGYLSSSGVNFRVSRADSVALVSPATSYRRWCQRMNERGCAVLAAGVKGQPGVVAIYRGMLLGQATDLSQDQKKLFTETGTLHLFSISGLHIAAIAVAMHMLFALCRLQGWLHFGAMLVALWLYVDITGASPSAVRAFIMVAAVEAAHALRRPMNPVAGVATAAFCALAVDPMQLFNASFQMSYGIVMGLILLGLPLTDWLQEHTAPFRSVPRVVWETPHHVLHWLHRTATGALGIGLATSLVSSVCGLLYFELFTPGALIANLLLIPVSTLSLWAGFLSLLSGLLQATFLCVVFNHAAALTLWFVEGSLRWLVQMPGMFFEGSFISAAAGFVALGGLMLVLLHGYSQQWRGWHATWVNPFGWTALALLVLVQW